jgi:hypothetical protein
MERGSVLQPREAKQNFDSAKPGVAPRVRVSDEHPLNERQPRRSNTMSNTDITWGEWLRALFLPQRMRRVRVIPATSIIQLDQEGRQ